MTHSLERRLERVETRQRHVSIETMAAILAPEVGLDLAELVDETEAILAQCERFRLTSVEAMLPFYAEEFGVAPDVLRAGMTALQERLRWRRCPSGLRR